MADETQAPEPAQEQPQPQDAPQEQAQAADSAPTKKASPDDVVYRYVGKGAFVTTPYGTLPQRDITRAEAPALLRTKGWRDAVLASGAYEPVDGTRVLLPDVEDGPASE